MNPEKLPKKDREIIEALVISDFKVKLSSVVSLLKDELKKMWIKDFVGEYDLIGWEPYETKIDKIFDNFLNRKRTKTRNTCLHNFAVCEGCYSRINMIHLAEAINLKSKENKGVL